MRLFKNILVCVIVLGIFALHPSMNKGNNVFTYLHYVVYGNSFNLSIEDENIKDNLKVVWENIDPDGKLNQVTVYENSKSINKIPAEVGQQQLVVYYHNTRLGVVGHQKELKELSHKYNIDIEVEQRELTVLGEIEGPIPSRNVEVANLDQLDPILAMQ